MKKLSILATFVFVLFAPKVSLADDAAFFKIGPLSLNIPFKTAAATYMFDFHARENLVGGETTVLTLWNRVEGTFGAVTSLQGAGTPFVGGNILLGNIIDKYITLPSDLKIGGFGGYNFRTEAPIYGIKASVQLW